MNPIRHTLGDRRQARSRRLGTTASRIGLLLAGLGWAEAQGQTLVSGSLHAHTTWTRAGSPYQVTGTVRVEPGVTLTVEAGVQVRFAQYQGLTVDGTLRAMGNTGTPILFTGTTETPNWWSGIVVRNAGSATLEHTQIRYAGYWNRTGLLKTGTGDLTLRHTTFEHNDLAGLNLQAGSRSFVFDQNSFSHNTRGVQVGLNASFRDDDATVYADNGADVFLEGGTLTQDTQWYLNPAYSMLVGSSLTVGTSAQLEILPGTVLKFAQYQGLLVDGSLSAVGTARAPIQFTDWRDDRAGGDANRDAAATAPAPDWWSGIVVRNTGSATLEHAQVRYAGYWNQAGLVKLGAGDLTLLRSAIQHTAGDGLRLENSAGEHLVERNALADNRTGVFVRNQARTLVLTANLIERNTDFGVRNQASPEVDARGNWWGHASGPRHAVLNPEGQGDAVSNGVQFEPWRTEPSAGEIRAPVRSGTLVAGDWLRFSGSTLPQDGATYRWNLSDGRAYSTREPGLVQFPQTGDFTVTYSVTADGSEDPHPDSRTYSVVADSGRLPDLRVVHVQVAGTLAVGQTASLAYTVRNVGQGPAGPAWRDAAFLSRDPHLDTEDMYLGSTAVNRDLPADHSYRGTIPLSLPAVDEGAYHVILVLNHEWEVLEQHRLNNEFATPITAEVPTLAEGVLYPVSHGAGRLEQYFRMNTAAGKNLVLDLTRVPSGWEVFLRFGLLPTRTVYDHHQRGGESLLLPAAAPGDWYVLVYGDPAQAGEYHLRFSLEDLTLTHSSPARHGTASDLELTLNGAGFTPPLQVELVADQGQTHAAARTDIDSFTRATATFPAGTVPAGTYAVRVSQAGRVAELPDALEITPGGTSNFHVQLILPAQFGYHILATVFVEYTNTGETSLPAPLLLVTATQRGRPGAILTLDQNRLSSGFWTSAMPEGFAPAVQFLASGATPGVLQPGESRRVPVYYAGWQKPWDFSYPPLEWHVGVLDAANPTPIDWNGLKDGQRPDYVPEDAWNVLWDNFTTLAGSTWGQYVAMLSRNALFLHRHGQRTEDLPSLQAFTFRQAEGFSPIAELAGAVDAVVPAPGLPIVFERNSLPQLSRRFVPGPLGRGWTHNWQLALRVAPDQTVRIIDRTGTPRLFQPDSRYPGRYLAQPGDAAELRAVADGYRLTEADGITCQFNAAGEWTRLEDPNGNHITCSYHENRLTRLTHSSGPALHLAYNAEGRLASLTDPQGRQTRFSYTGDHLTAVTAYDGRTTAYSYHTASGPSHHALTGIRWADGTTRTYTYDVHGRLSGVQGADPREHLTLSHAGIGRVDLTDALGQTNRFLFDHWGRLFRTENPLGEAVQLTFDELGHLTALTDPGGFRTTFAYDRQGNLLETVDALRRVTRLTYTRAFNRLASVVDPLNHRTEYTYDPRGNLLGITDPEGRQEHWTFDPHGQPASWTNRRGAAVAYQHDPAGRVTRKEFADGSRMLYRHDTRGNLAETEDSRGTTRFEYNDNDSLLRVTYPGNRWIEFTYDSFGRRASSQDQLGHRVHYHYDSAGRLSRLSEAAGDIVWYAYDPLGRLARRTLGNGTYTAYTYDPAGRLLEQASSTGNEQVLSRFHYSYDQRGRRIALQTHYGQWTYEYDATGQLTRAVLRSIDPAIADQDLTYEYDAAGNRTRTLSNGIAEAYVSNPLNQLVRVGNQAYTYDPDGNLIGEDGPAGSHRYRYDAENRLVGITRGKDTWECTYDALGHRVAINHNGTITHYVHDPLGLGNLLAEYNDAGALLTRYTHGLGLVRRTPADSSSDYYTFDPMGNTSELSGATGAKRNEYAYRPFGETLFARQTVPNPFLFMGELGVLSDPHGWHHVRARHYDARLGRFTTRDPIGFIGGDVNLYRYAMNSPGNVLDPTGLSSMPSQCANARWRGVVDFVDGTAYVVVGAFTATGFGWTGGGAAAGILTMGYGFGNAAWGGALYLSGRDELPRFADIPKTLVRLGISQLPSAQARHARRVVSVSDFVSDVLKFVRISNWVDVGELLREAGFEKLAAYCPYNRRPVPAPPACPLPSRRTATPHARAEHAFMLAQAGRAACLPFVPVITGDAGLAASHDPNEKLAVGGYGARNFTAGGTLLRYQIDFENLDSATAPAQIVTIRDPLSPDLDLDTFEIAEVGFGEVIVPVGGQRRHFAQFIAYDYHDDQYQFTIEVQVEVWLEGGVVHANFLTLDPRTGLPPQEVGIGFLPPENGTGRGQGYVAYQVRPHHGLASGTAIRNVATIQFDFGLEIDTNQVDPLDKTKGTDPAKEALVTLDTVPPVSRVLDLPAVSPAQFTVAWSGTDDAAGVREYDIQVSRDGSSYESWLRATRLTSAVFDGVSDQTYRFHSLAVDHAGNREAKAPLAEATTTVAAATGLRILAAGWNEETFTVQIPTETDRTYVLEAADHVVDPHWIGLDQVTGDDTVQTLVDRQPPPTARFYRVRVD
ncbi:MAG: hypothetical protein HS113_10790 [Verrucomicrobiales bacterium]|nr:hypothetical protein [Verrucomicrobiales bacterium]